MAQDEKFAFKMWRMGLLIRHKCGERKNTVGHRWSKATLYNLVAICHMWRQAFFFFIF